MMAGVLTAAFEGSTLVDACVEVLELFEPVKFMKWVRLYVIGTTETITAKNTEKTPFIIVEIEIYLCTIV